MHALAFGKPLGLTDEQLAATAGGLPTDPAWDQGSDALLIRLADELHETYDVSDPLWSALAERYNEDQLLELLIIAGWYRLLSYVINAARVQREPWAARFPEG